MIDVLELLGDDELEAHTSVVLTYELDLTLYDGLVYRTLNTAGVVNQMVFCDLKAHLPALDGVTNLRRIGKKYSVTPVLLENAFHPKLYLLLGRRRGRILLGSGNATTGGLLRNAELFGSFQFDASLAPSPHPAFQVSVELIGELVKRAAEPVQRQFERALAWTPWISRTSAGDGRELLFSGPGRRALLDQLKTRIEGRTVERAIVCSSSFDRNLNALGALASLTSEKQIDCIVSHERVDLDGAAVRRRRDQVRWHPFVDPPVKDRKHRRDARLHAKLFLFLCGDTEIAAFGSANASQPALMTDKSVEALVVLPPLPRGTIEARLDLKASLEAGALNEELEASVWPSEPNDDLEGFPIVLSAATVQKDAVVLTIARGKPASDTHVAILSSPLQPPSFVAPLSETDGVFYANVAWPERAVLAQLVGLDGRLRSNAISLTWHAVAERSITTGLGAKVEHALSALADGLVIGTTLFELLGQIPDFEIVFGAGSGAAETKRSAIDEAHFPAGAGDVFYTDAVQNRATPGDPSGDRTDLEILARLIQPLRGGAPGAPVTPVDEDEDEDDQAIQEEDQRRALNEQQRTGNAPRSNIGKPSAKDVERARRRLVRRLARAASSLEGALSVRSKLKSLPPSSIARQLWMLRVAAALTGREIPVAEEVPVVGLEPGPFAEYVLRVSRALSGGKDGGLLALVPEQAFTGHDGEILREGLRFLWSCTIWAASVLVDSWMRGAEVYTAKDVHDVAPELVAARFIKIADRYCDEPDLIDIERRFPAWSVLGEGWFSPREERIYTLAALIDAVESGMAGGRAHVGVQPLAPGRLVYHPITGVTILMSVDGDKSRLLDLSDIVDIKRKRFPLRTFKSAVSAVRLDHPLGGLLFRKPGWL